MTTMEITPAFRAAEAWHPRVLKHQSLQRLKQNERYFERMVLFHLSAYLKLVLQHFNNIGTALDQEEEADHASLLLLSAVERETDWDKFRQDIAGAYGQALLLGINYGARDLPKFGKSKVTAEPFKFAGEGPWVTPDKVEAVKKVYENLTGPGGMEEQQALDSLYAIYGKTNIDEALKAAGVEFKPGKKPKGPPPTTDYATFQIEWDAMADPDVATWINTRTGRLVTNITDTTRQRIKQAIKAGVTLGESRDEIAERLQDVMDDVPQWRAKLIAQTEVIEAHSAGAVMTYKKSKVVEGKRWVDGQAGACAICSGLNNKIISLDGTYYQDQISLVGKVGFGPPAHPGCRCTVAPVVKIAPPPEPKPQVAPIPNTSGRNYIPVGKDLTLLQKFRDYWRDALNGLTVSERGSLKSYTGSMYGSLNHSLRKGLSLDSSLQVHSKNIDSAFKRFGADRDLLLYRGDGGFQNAKVGDIITDNGYVSMSTDEQFARGWASSRNVPFLIVKVPQGTPGAYVGYISNFGHGEGEFILGRGSKFKVEKREEKVTKAGKKYVELTVEIQK